MTADNKRGFMKFQSILLIIIAIGLTLNASAQLKAAHFPAESSYLVHINVAQLAKSKTGALLKASMDEKTNRKIDALGAMSDIDLMQDIDSIYFAGLGAQPDSGTLYATGRFDVNKLTTILGGNEGFSSEQYGKYKILNWSHEDTAYHGCFVNPGLVVVSSDAGSTKKSLDLFDGKGAALQAESDLANVIAAKPNRFLALIASDMSGLPSENQPPQLQMFKQARGLSLFVDQSSADKADVLLSAVVTAADMESAQQLGMMLQGFQAMMMMQAQQNPEVAALAQNFKIAPQDKQVKMSLLVNEAQLKKQIEKAALKRDDPDAAPPAIQ